MPKVPAPMRRRTWKRLLPRGSPAVMGGGRMIPVPTSVPRACLLRRVGGRFSMAAKTSPSRRSPKKRGESDSAVSYDEFKTHEGHRYTGMKVGRSHKWYY